MTVFQQLVLFTSMSLVEVKYPKVYIKIVYNKNSRVQHAEHLFPKYLFKHESENTKSCNFLPAGLIAAIIIVFELPPKLSFSSQVRTESR